MNVDIVRPGDDLSGYKLVLAPHLHVLADDDAKQLVEYVRGGGVLLTDCRIAVKDETNLAYARTLPGLLSPALGIEIDEYESLRQGITDKDEITYTMGAEDLPTVTTSPQLRRLDHTDHRQADRALRRAASKGIRRRHAERIRARHRLVRRHHCPRAKFYDALVAQLLADAKFKPLVAPPPGVEISFRSNDQYAAASSSITTTSRHRDVPADRQELLTGETTQSSLDLPPFGVAVIQLIPSDLERSSDKSPLV